MQDAGHTIQDAGSKMRDAKYNLINLISYFSAPDLPDYHLLNGLSILQQYTHQPTGGVNRYMPS